MTQHDLNFHLSRWRLMGKKIVFTNGCFDLLHTGHLEMIAEARDLGHMLVVGLNSDASVKRLKGENRPVLNENERAFALASLMWVDVVILFDEDTPLEVIKAVKPEVLVKGGDYDADTIVGSDIVRENGGEVVIIPLREGYSSTNLIKKLKK